MICAFYSAESKTGQSMALGNVAQRLRRNGHRVIVADWNLEDPGLDRLFPAVTERAAAVQGFIDFLVAYKAEMLRPIPADRDDLVLPTESVEDYLAQFPDDHGPGQLLLMPAGRRDATYGERVASFDWEEFYRDFEGALLFQRLRDRLRQLADLTLIDLGAGATALGMACAFTLADVVLMLCPVGSRSIESTNRRAQQLRTPGGLGLRNGSPCQVIVVPARIEYGEADLLNRFKEQFIATFDALVPEPLAHLHEAFWRLRIPNIPYFAYRNSIVFERPGDAIAEPLVEAYSRLAETLSSLFVSFELGEPPGGRADGDTMELDRFRALRARKTDTPSVFISYARDDEVVVRQLYQSLTDAGFRAWLDKENLLGGEHWTTVIEEQIENSDFVLVCLSHQSVAKKGYVQKEMRKTLEVVELQPEGKVYLIPVRLDACEIPRSMSRFNCIDLFEQTGFARLEQSIRQAWRRSRVGDG